MSFYKILVALGLLISLSACSGSTKVSSEKDVAIRGQSKSQTKPSIKPRQQAVKAKSAPYVKKVETAEAAPSAAQVVRPLPKKAADHSPPKVYKKAVQKPGKAVGVQDKKMLVVLDAGHGGYDLGAKMSSVNEKSLCLSTALLTKKYLTEMGYQVILTRSRDVFIPLEQRATIANDTKSQLFVSLHFNAAKSQTAQGVEIFYYDSKDKFRSSASRKLARNVLNKVLDKTGAHSRGVKGGNFYVIRETKMPAILVEGGFITHEEEGHLLRDSAYREKLARGIAEGIDNFFKG